MDRLIEYIFRFGNLNKQQIDLIKSKATEIEPKKDEYLSEAGKISRQVGFVLDGVFRFCYYNNKDEEITDYLIDENHFVTDYQNFAANMSPSEYVQAVTNCKLVLFLKKDWDELCTAVVGIQNTIA